MEGFVFADVPNRIVAMIIDGFVILVLGIIVGIVLGIAGVAAGGIGSTRFDLLGTLIATVVGFAISIGYFLYSWTRMRATVGMRALGMQVGNAFDGKTLTNDQAIRRALALWGPSTAAEFLVGVPTLGNLLGLLAFVWAIYLLYTTAKSPTKQGFHDIYANSVVVKAMRVA